MNDCVIQGASYLGPEGHGNDLTGLRPWPVTVEASLRRGDLTPLHWSLLFASDAPRFARMDLMCRLGLMATELLEAGFQRMPAEQRARVGVSVGTTTGTLGTDIRFLQTPRPTLFTYTLPSTVLGEICIRYRLQGAQLCLISAGPAAVAQANQAEEPSLDDPLAEAADWLDQGTADAAVCLACEALDSATLAALPPACAWGACPWHAGRKPRRRHINLYQQRKGVWGAKEPEPKRQFVLPIHR